MSVIIQFENLKTSRTLYKTRKIRTCINILSVYFFEREKWFLWGKNTNCKEPGSVNTVTTLYTGWTTRVRFPVEVTFMYSPPLPASYSMGIGHSFPGIKPPPSAEG